MQCVTSDVFQAELFPEIWPLPGHPGYFVTRDGRAYLRKGTVLQELRLYPSGKKSAYRVFSLPNKDNIGIHRAVAITFLPPPKIVGGKMQYLVRHLDNNPSNNHVSNLAWGTATENRFDQIAAGTMTWGEKNGRAKLTEDQVREIRRRRVAGETCIAIAREFAVSKYTVQEIGCGKKWKHIDGPLVRVRTRRISRLTAGA